MSNKITTIFLVSFLSLSLLAPSFIFLAYPKKAEASVPIHCTPFLDLNCIKEFSLDLIARVIAATLIRGLTNSIIAWIQGNGGENVGFVGNLEQEFRRQVDMRGGEFLNKVAGINLCGDIGAFLQISLRTNAPSLRQRLECSVTDIVENVNDFFTDFSNGGWPAFIRISQEHQNNPYGASWIAFNAKIQAEGEAAAALQQTLLSNDGFRGVTKKINAKCEAGGAGVGTLQCFTEYVIKTPGKLVSNLLTEAGASGPRFAYVADEIDEAIAAIINALISKLIGSVQEGIFNPGLSDLPVDYNNKSGVLNINTNGTLPSSLMGTPYFVQLNATGGVTPYTWVLVSGNVPGLTLSIDGIISGIPTTEGIYGLLIRVTDRVHTSVLKQFVITINASSVAL